MDYIIAKEGSSNLMNVKWIKLKVLGRGCYGVVHLVQAKNSVSGQVFAVKSCDDRVSYSLQKELKILKELDGHPNVVQCYGWMTSVEQDRVVYNLFLEYASGGNLLDLIQKNYGGKIPEADARCYARMLFEGVRDIHARGYVHCDLKPENILVYPPNKHAPIHVLKIADFGLARKPGQGMSGPDNPPWKLNFPGTPVYMPPETLNATKISVALDIWSQGCVLLQMVTGELPWECDTVVDLVSKLASPMKYPEIPEDMSSEGKDFMMKCFNRDTSRRWTASMLLTHPFLLPDRKSLQSQNPEVKN